MGILRTLRSLVPDFWSFAQIVVFVVILLGIESRASLTKSRIALQRVIINREQVETTLGKPLSSDVERVTRELDNLRFELGHVGFFLQTIGLILVMLKIQEIKVAKKQN